MTDETPERRTRRISEELRPYVNRTEAVAIDEVAERIGEARPVPRPAFRSELRARLSGLGGGGALGRRPKRLHAAIAASAGSGIALLGVAALGVAGSGPLGF